MIALLFAAAQHCGGPCEVPRGADPVSADPKYVLVAGREKENWRYLWNWIWTEDGVEKHRLEKSLSSPPLRDFGYRRMFVSSAGNGFLVTGNAYAKAEKPPLFVFCDPEGTVLVEISLERGLTKEERRLGPCPNCDCAKVLYEFEEDPSLSVNGCFVELTACGTKRRLGFFLPLGVPVRDRARFETALSEAAWADLPDERRATEKREIETLARDLDHEDLDVRAKAVEGLIAKGYLALEAARSARFEEKLKPGKDVAIDLGLLAALLPYPDEDVVAAVRGRLERIVPQIRGKDPAAWLREHRAKLTWNAAAGRYE